jgi:type II secretory pathway predicted ATPase ExeA
LLVAQPELKEILRHQSTYLREVIQRLEVVDLLPLDNDLGPYLHCRAAAAGRKLDELLDKGGVDELRARLTTTRRDASGRSRTVSLCYPLAVNNLLTAALNKAAEIGAPLVTRDVVRAI